LRLSTKKQKKKKKKGKEKNEGRKKEGRKELRLNMKKMGKFKITKKFGCNREK
jgi:hypothetical protein